MDSISRYDIAAMRTMYLRVVSGLRITKYEKGNDVSDEPRDSDGKWTKGGASGSSTSSDPVSEMAQLASDRGWSAKVMKAKAIAANLDPAAVRSAAAEIARSGGRKSYEGPIKPKWTTTEGRHAIEDQSVIDQNWNHANDSLTASGFSLANESPSGSRYYIRDGEHVRVSDHEPNEATAMWMEKVGATDLRVNRKGFPDTLKRLSGQ